MLSLLKLNALQLHTLSSFCVALIQEYSDYSLDEIYERLSSGETLTITRDLQERIWLDFEQQQSLSKKQYEDLSRILSYVQGEEAALSEAAPDEILEIPSIIKKNEKMSLAFIKARRFLLEKKEMQVRALQEDWISDANFLERSVSITNVALDNIQHATERYGTEQDLQDLQAPQDETNELVSYTDVRDTDDIRTDSRSSENNTRKAIVEHEYSDTNRPDPMPRQPFISRYLQSDVSEQIKIGEHFPLFVKIVLTNSIKNSLLRSFHVPSEGVTVKISINSPAFVILSQPTQSVHVPLDSDSDPLLFELEARRMGTHNVEIMAFKEGAFLGSHIVTISVDNAQTQPPVRQRGLMYAKEPGDGETTLTVRFDSERRGYRYVLRNGVIGETPEHFSGPLSRPREKLIQDFVATLNEIANQRGAMSSKGIKLKLKGQGKTLWDEIIPAELKRTFFEYRDSIKQLRIMCDQDPIPWEVLYPSYEEGDDKGFLAQQFPVTRWRSGPPEPLVDLNMSQPLFVLPNNGPKHAKNEVNELRKMLKGGRVVENFDDLISELEVPCFDLLHFACHNTFSPGEPLSSYIAMNGSSFSPDMLSGIGKKTLESLSPLVFMNACRTAGSAPTYTQLSGWANAFLDFGAAAFIGSLWEIRDSSAAEFAEGVYNSLLAEETLGEAVLQARQKRYDDDGDPTRLAYVLYGDPNASVLSQPS